MAAAVLWSAARRNASRTRAFGGPRFQSSSLTRGIQSSNIARASRSRLPSTDPDAPSRGAITRLSYAGTQDGCPSWCRRFQIAPQRPAPLLTPHQPTCRAGVIPFRASLRGDSHPFAAIGDSGCYHPAHVHVAQSADPIPSGSVVDSAARRTGSKVGVSPTSARCSRARGITRTRLLRWLTPDWRSGAFPGWLGPVQCVGNPPLVRPGREASVWFGSHGPHLPLAGAPIFGSAWATARSGGSPWVTGGITSRVAVRPPQRPSIPQRGTPRKGVPGCERACARQLRALHSHCVELRAHLFDL